MNDQTDLTEPMRKIVQLMGLLGSDYDQEVISAARAIRKTLNANGLTFGDLKAIMIDLLDPQHVGKDMMRVYVRQLRQSINYAMMQDYERHFVKDISMRFSVDPEYKLTEKQENWFFSLYARYAA
jgi:hypothetical protein